MRLHELVPNQGQVVIHNEWTGNTVVLTCVGAVYNTENTNDVRNMSIAFGALITSDAWRLATQEEIEDLRAHPPVTMLELQWAVPPPKPRPKLTIVKD